MLIPHKYGLHFPQQIDEMALELYCFRTNASKRGRYFHLRNFYKIVDPDMEWNPWLEDMMQTFCDDDYATKIGDTVFRSVSLVGCAGSGKTFAAGRFAWVWWLAQPDASIVILTSTTKDMISRRVWPVIQDCYHTARRTIARKHNISEEDINCGRLLDSEKILCASKGDRKHSISALAVKDGQTSKAEANLRGQHAPRILVVIDEANQTPEAIFGTIPNLRKACQDFMLIVVGNPESRLDAHGKCCAPVNGFGSRTHNQIKWKTRGVPEWQIEPGICLQFRGELSPNVKAGRTVHKHIYSWEDYQATLRHDTVRDLRFFAHNAGDWAPEGFLATVFNETMAERCNLSGSMIFHSKATPISFLDPGFGGDKCVQKIAKLGDIDATGKLGLLVIKSIDLVLDPSSKDDFEHQIARQAIVHCKEHNVSPEHFGIFSTGTGRGAASVLYSDWSDAILKVEEGGLPSELPASSTDSRASCDIYDRKVTELWFSAREFALGGQIAGLDNETIVQLCAREYDLTGKPAKYRVETKDKLKPKLGRSCDDADCLVGLIELARVRFGAVAGGAYSERLEAQSQEPDSHSRLLDNLVETTDYSDENERQWLLADSA